MVGWFLEGSFDPSQEISKKVSALWTQGWAHGLEESEIFQKWIRNQSHEDNKRQPLSSRVGVLVRKPDVEERTIKGSMVYDTASGQDRVGHTSSLVWQKDKGRPPHGEDIYSLIILCRERWSCVCRVVTATLASTLDACGTSPSHDHQKYVCRCCKIVPLGSKIPLGKRRALLQLPCQPAVPSHQDAWTRTLSPRISCPVRPRGVEVKRPWGGAVRIQGWTYGRSRTDLGQLLTQPQISYERLSF